MKHDNLTFKLLTNDNIREIVVLGQQLHQKLTLKQVEEYQNQMFEFSTYNCFGLFLNDQLIGISSG